MKDRSYLDSILYSLGFIADEPTPLPYRVVRPDEPKPRAPQDMAPAPQESAALARALSGDMPEQRPDRTTAMKQMFLDQSVKEGMRALGIEPTPFPTAEAAPPSRPAASAPERVYPPANQRDMPERPQFGQDTAMRQMFLNRRIDDDIRRMEAEVNPRNPSGGMSYAPGIPGPMPRGLSDAGVRKPVSAYEAPRQAIPIPRARPMPTAHTVSEGDNPTKIAKRYGLTLAELEAKNPGILKKARRMKIGSKVNI